MTSDPVERYLLRATRGGRAFRLRPMSTAEMFDLALRVYRTLGWTILKHSALPTLFTVAGAAFLLNHVLPGFGWTQRGATDSAQVIDAAMLFLLGILVGGPLILIGLSLTTTFVAPLVADYMLGHVPNAAAARQAQLRTSGRMLLVSLYESLVASSGVIVAGGLFAASWALGRTTGAETGWAGLALIAAVCALIVGGIVCLAVASVHALAAPAAALEDLSARKAAKRSKQLMRNREYHGSGYNTVWSLYAFVAILGLGIGAGAATFKEILALHDWAGEIGLPSLRPVVEGVLGLMTWYTVFWVCVPVWAATVTVIYFERRVRLEGYDIEALAADSRRADREGRFQL